MSFAWNSSTLGNYKREEERISERRFESIRVTRPCPFCKGTISPDPIIETVIAVELLTILVAIQPARQDHWTYGRGHLLHGRRDLAPEREKGIEKYRGRVEEKGHLRVKGKGPLTKGT
jgi:hypothetical protein